jgi:MoxR-like ATPase
MATAIAPSPTAAVDAAVDQLRQLEQVLNTELIARSEHIAMALVALVARQHMFMYGPPGAGKTFLIDRLAARIDDARYVSVLFGKTLPPEETFGPLDVPAYVKEGRYVRNIEGYLPSARLFMADEIWKAGPAQLNPLLKAFNERQFRNDGRLTRIPLSSVFSASNEFPQDESNELAAIYDRILIRMVTDQLTDAEDFKAMLRLEVDEDPDPLLHWDDVEVAQRAAAALPVTDEVGDALWEIKAKLRSLGHDPSDRRFRLSQSLLRAQALLEGADEVVPAHAEVLAHVMWDRAEQALDVERAVASIVAPDTEAALKLSDSIASLGDDIRKVLAAEPVDMGELNHLFDKQKRAKKEVVKALKGAAGKGKRVLTDADRVLDNQQRSILGAMGVDVDEVAKLR